MIDLAPTDGHYTADQYFALAECGILSPDDRTELLDGLIVAMAPPTPLHCSVVNRVQFALQRKLGLDVNVRVQSTFVAGSTSAPEPDIAVLPGAPEDYEQRHPSRADLVVEVSLSSLVQDRLTKPAIYARADVPCYWVVNLRDHCVEVYRGPDRWNSVYAVVERKTGRDTLLIDAFPAVTFTADEFLPSRPLGGLPPDTVDDEEDPR